VDSPRAILAPVGDDQTLRETVRRLRKDGEIVVQRLPDEVGSAEPGDFIFDRELRRVGSDWQLAARDITAPVK